MSELTSFADYYANNGHGRPQEAVYAEYVKSPAVIALQRQTEQAAREVAESNRANIQTAITQMKAHGWGEKQISEYLTTAGLK